jgi:hypothetical protein
MQELASKHLDVGVADLTLQENSQLPTAKTIFRRPRQKLLNIRRPRTQPSEVIYLPTAADRAVGS